MNSIKKKLIFSIFTVMLTIITLTSTTYAWFASNKTAWTDEFMLDIEQTDGLYISIDNQFSTNVTADNLKKAIVAKMNGLSTIEDKDILTTDYVNTEFAKIELAYSGVTTNDLVSFKTINPDRLTVDSDNSYTYMEAAKTGYIQFDLFLKVELSKAGADKAYDLRLVNSEYAAEAGLPDSYITRITGENNTVKLSSNLVTQTQAYNSGDEIEINPVNAMRIGINNEQDNIKVLYEPYEGLGSYAIENGTGKYNPSTNAMFTYFNTEASKYKLKAIPEAEKEFYINAKTFNDEITLGRFRPDATGDEYNIVKLTVSIWLEGMDADYITGISANTIKFYLNFCKVEVDA